MIEAMHLRALMSRKKVLDSEPSMILSTINSQGLLYEDQNKLVKFVIIHQRVLAKKEKATGLKHPLTLQTKNMLRIYLTRR